MESIPEEIISSLAVKAIRLLGKTKELEKICWIVVHEYCNGCKPVEYDIREIDEELYLAVLKTVKDKIEV